MSSYSGRLYSTRPGAVYGNNDNSGDSTSASNYNSGDVNTQFKSAWIRWQLVGPRWRFRRRKRFEVSLGGLGIVLTKLEVRGRARTADRK